jgi:hypothetical protein
MMYCTYVCRPICMYDICKLHLVYVCLYVCIFAVKICEGVIRTGHNSFNTCKHARTHARAIYIIFHS